MPELDLDLDAGGLLAGAGLRLLKQFQPCFPDDFLVLECRGYPGVIHGIKGDDRTPVNNWWHTWSMEDKRRARELFRTMRSGSGFVNDLQQARPDRASYRRLIQTRTICPTLVTASRQDAGVAFAHAEDYAGTIPGAMLVELDAPSHLFWLGPAREEAQAAVSAFMASRA